MPASRFFAMSRAAQVLRAREQLEELDAELIAVGGPKLYDHLRERYMARLDKAAGFRPVEKLPDVITNAHLTPEQKVIAAMQQFAYLKRLNGYGG